MTINFSPAEVRRAVLVGGSRQYQALKRNLEDRKHTNHDGWGLHIEGAGAELAACKALGVKWQALVNTFKIADIPPDIEVRGRSSAHYDLCIRDSDNPLFKFVLVTGAIPEFNVVGWIEGKDAMLPQYRLDPNGRGEAWFVPQKVLRPLEDLVIRGQEANLVMAGR